MNECTCDICKTNTGNEYVYYSAEGWPASAIDKNGSANIQSYKGHVCNKCISKARWVRVATYAGTFVVVSGLGLLFSYLNLTILGGGFILGGICALVLTIVALFPQKGSNVLADHHNKELTDEKKKYISEAEYNKVMRRVNVNQNR